MKILLVAIISFALTISAFSASKPINPEDSSAGIGQYMMPDLKNSKTGRANVSSCCGPADAYWADEFDIGFDENGNSEYIAIITDPRKDDLFEFPSGGARIHIPIGTRIPIPNQKIITSCNPGKVDPNCQKPNTTGHGWVWIKVYQDEGSSDVINYQVYCYLTPPGA